MNNLYNKSIIILGSISFLFHLIITINGFYLFKEPFYILKKADNIRSGPSTKYSIIKTFDSNNYTNIYLIQNKKGWQEIKSDLFNKKLFNAYVWVDNNATTGAIKGENLNLLKLEKRILTFYSISLNYFLSSLDFNYDFAKEFNNRTVLKFVVYSILFTLFCFIVIFLKTLIYLIFKRKKNSNLKQEIELPKEYSNNSLEPDINQESTYIDNQNEEIEKIYTEEEVKENKTTFENNFNTYFKDSEIYRYAYKIKEMKKTMGFDQDYNIEDAIKDNSYENFKLLIQLEMLKRKGDNY